MSVVTSDSLSPPAVLRALGEGMRGSASALAGVCVHRLLSALIACLDSRH